MVNETLKPGMLVSIPGSFNSLVKGKLFWTGIVVKANAKTVSVRPEHELFPINVPANLVKVF